MNNYLIVMVKEQINFFCFGMDLLLRITYTIPTVLEYTFTFNIKLWMNNDFALNESNIV